MNRMIILSLLLFPLTGFSQNFIGKTKTAVKKELLHQIEKYDSLTSSLTDKDSVLVYSLKENNVLSADFIYGFDRSGKCQSEKVMPGCDTCLKKYLQAVLADKKYEWKKINENQYVSKYAAKMMLELHGENKDAAYTILRTEWSKEMYDLLTGN
jgi:hypothetical protein